MYFGISWDFVPTNKTWISLPHRSQQGGASLWVVGLLLWSPLGSHQLPTFFHSGATPFNHAGVAGSSDRENDFLRNNDKNIINPVRK